MALPFSALTVPERGPSVLGDHDRKGVAVEYTQPEIVDYGTLEELTAGLPIVVTDDGGNKFHASCPGLPGGLRRTYLFPS
jgi:hypothetical protein